jgi:selenocysteine lyase/cysteine desulfurase
MIEDKHHSRRSFLKKVGIATGAGMIVPALGGNYSVQAMTQRIRSFEGQAPEEMFDNEDFWSLVKQAYTVSPTILNLNNGGVSPQPKVVQDAVERYNRLSNEAPSYYMWRILDQGREPLRSRLAGIAGCSPEEVAMDRNSSEALETVIFGLRLKAGDEVVLAKQDYPNMINAWEQRAHRDGVILKWVNLNLPSENEEELASKYTELFTSRTKVVHITHMINWNGQILPVRKIASAAQKLGIEVLVDGAHTFGHLDFEIPDLLCDYFGTSLHKWLCAPFGSGMLYVKKEKIKGLYPLFGSPDPESDDIRKFEHLGTRSFAIEQAIGQAIDFHEMIGPARKQQRLQYLKNYWSSKVNHKTNVSFGTPLHPEFSCALNLLKIEGKNPSEVAQFLFQKYKIHTVAIDWENIHGVRITPNVYTLASDLDRLVHAINELI